MVVIPGKTAQDCRLVGCDPIPGNFLIIAALSLG